MASDVSDCLIALSRRKWKKQDRLSAATWLAMVSWPSSRTPRPLATDESRTVAFCNSFSAFEPWPIVKLLTGTHDLCFLFVQLQAIAGHPVTDDDGSAWCTSSDDQSHQNGRWLVTVWFTTWCSLTTLKQPASAASWCSWDRMIDLLTEQKNYSKIHQAKIHTFPLKASYEQEMLRTQTPTGALPLYPVGGLQSRQPRPPEIWTHSYKNPAIRPWIYISAICC